MFAGQDFNLLPVLFHNCFTNRQAKSGTLAYGVRLVRHIEAIKHIWNILWQNADTVVLHGDI